MGADGSLKVKGCFPRLDPFGCCLYQEPKGSLPTALHVLCKFALGKGSEQLLSFNDQGRIPEGRGGMWDQPRLAHSKPRLFPVPNLISSAR